MNWSDIDWDALHRLRRTFLDNPSGSGDYWKSDSDLASYDATFAQRIGWKWDYVLSELQRRGWSPPKGELLDWGCGSGIASRVFLDQFGIEHVTGLNLWDRSALATTFATRRVREKFPTLVTRAGMIETPAVLLISHVLSELTPEQTQALADSAARAQATIWVEPGTFAASLTLIAVRERMRGMLKIIAPCTHQERCGILAPGNARHWCHHFATPPPGVFTDGNWSKFANLMGIDLRDLPLSFLALDQRAAAPLPTHATRVLGHPRIYKPHALLLSCNASGVSEQKLTKRSLPDAFRQLRKGAFDRLQLMQSVDKVVAATKPLFANEPGQSQPD